MEPAPPKDIEDEDKDEAMKEDTRDDNIDDMEWMKRHMSRSMQLEEGPSKEFYQDDDDDISGKRDEAVSLYNDVKYYPTSNLSLSLAPSIWSWQI